jgi:hypothetical protein
LSKTFRLRLQNISKLEIIVGTVDRTDRKLIFSVEKIIINYCYSIFGVYIEKVGSNYINSLRINDNLVVNSVCLPKIDSEPIYLKVVLSGWGRVDLDKEGLPKILNKAVTKLYSIQKCRINWFDIGLKKTYASKI